MGEVLVSARGQVDNLGDSVLRRGLLRALRRAGDLTISVVGMPPGYLTGLGLSDADVLVSDPARWGPTLTRGLLGGALYGYNAGETYATAGYARHCFTVAPLLLAGRLRGGRSVHTGFGIRAPHPFWGRALRLGLAGCDELTWRDASSLGWVGAGTLSPDWAYGEGSSNADLERAAVTGPDGPQTAAGRDVLAVSLRFDRPLPDATWLASVRELARSRGLTVVALPQVGRDNDRAVVLARELGGEVLAWHGNDHGAREDVVRSVLRRSSFVVSDRLHALVLGHTEGALPIGLGTAGVDKIARTLATVGLVDVTGVQTELTVREAVGLLDGIDSRRSELLALVRPARARLAELSDRIAALGSARPSPRGREVRLGTGP